MKEMGKKAKEKIERDFLWNNGVEKLKAVYSEVLSR
jgi:glycosyltransferase involved in cell wall biosynthesis